MAPLANQSNFVGGTIKPHRRISMKQNKCLVLGILAVVLTFGIIAAGCDNGTSPGGGPSLDKALVAKWYTYPTQVGDPDVDPMFEITAAGRLLSITIPDGEVNVTTSGGIISSTVTYDGQTTESGTAKYTITGNRLLLSNPKIGDAPGGLFQPFVSAIQTAQELDALAGGTLGADGYLHKSGNTNGETDAPKTIVIKNMPSSIYSGLLARHPPVSVFVCAVGTSVYAASTQGQSVASASIAGATAVPGGGAYTVTLQLFKYGTTTRWTGHGTFDILWPDESYFDGYRASSVNISAKTTIVNFSSFSGGFPPPPLP
jgi:hypothetical protein